MMRNYNELSQIYDTKYLHYIMHRSKQLVDRWHLEYDDLINDGLLKLVEVYNKNKLAKDKAVMISLVNLYNDIHERQKNAMRTVSLETLHDTIGYWGGTV